MPLRQFQYDFFPFGLGNGGLVFTCLIYIQGHKIQNTYLVFSYNICVYSNRTFEDHIQKVKTVLERL